MSRVWRQGQPAFDLTARSLYHRAFVLPPGRRVSSGRCLVLLPIPSQDLRRTPRCVGDCTACSSSPSCTAGAPGSIRVSRRQRKSNCVTRRSSHSISNRTACNGCRSTMAINGPSGIGKRMSCTHTAWRGWPQKFAAWDYSLASGLPLRCLRTCLPGADASRVASARRRGAPADHGQQFAGSGIFSTSAILEHGNGCGNLSAPSLTSGGMISSRSTSSSGRYWLSSAITTPP